LAVARTGTLSAAAEQLGTEHTTVARRIHALEKELDSRLSHRSNSGYGLTEVGERLLAGAEAIESAYAAAKAAVSSEGQTIGGTVRIGTPDGFGSLFPAPRIRCARPPLRICRDPEEPGDRRPDPSAQPQGGYPDRDYGKSVLAALPSSGGAEETGGYRCPSRLCWQAA
jgi:DNA-binding transcriptional LysR family regulator